MSPRIAPMTLAERASRKIAQAGIVASLIVLATLLMVDWYFANSYNDKYGALHLAVKTRHTLAVNERISDEDVELDIRRVTSTERLATGIKPLVGKYVTQRIGARAAVEIASVSARPVVEIEDGRVLASVIIKSRLPISLRPGAVLAFVRDTGSGVVCASGPVDSGYVLKWIGTASDSSPELVMNIPAAAITDFRRLTGGDWRVVVLKTGQPPEGAPRVSSAQPGNAVCPPPTAPVKRTAPLRKTLGDVVSRQRLSTPTRPPT